MNQMTKIAPVAPVQKLSDTELKELLEYNRVAYQAAVAATKSLKQEITVLGREQARREGIMFPPSFETILQPHNRRVA